VCAPANWGGDSNPTILLFHDSLGCVDLWRNFPKELAGATSRSVVAYDRLGFGKSDAYFGTLPLTFNADEAITAIQVCEELGIKTIIPFGHSVGGAMAIAAAARSPDRCAAVITESTQSFVEDQTLSGDPGGSSRVREAGSARPPGSIPRGESLLGFRRLDRNLAYS
jgi:pimeloyl-ACP methyl ester carboxylesterase